MGIDLKLIEEGERLRERQLAREERDRKQKLKFEAARRRGSVIPPGTASPGAPSSRAASAHPTAGPGMTRGGGAPFIDAMRLSSSDYRGYLQRLGLDSSWYEAHERPPPPLPDPRFEVAQRRADAVARERSRRRGEAIEATKIDGRKVAPELAEVRLRALLGRHVDPDVMMSFRPVGRELDPLATDAERRLQARATEQDVRRRVRGAVAAGRKLDGRQMGPLGVKARLESLGLADPNSWGPATASVDRNR